MQSAKRRLIILTVITTLMALSLTFLAPSGAILPDAAQRYLNETIPSWDDDTEDAWDYDLGGAIGYLASAALTDAILPAYDIAYLSVDAEEIGRYPIEENFTETGYQDKSIIVEIDTVRQYDSTFHVAYVKIATPSQLRTAVAGSSTLVPTKFSKAMNAVVLINGDYFNKWENGYIVRQGEIYRWKASSKTDLLLIDENSDFHVILHGDTKSVEEDAVDALMTEHEIINAFYFGPGLVVDGELQEIPDDYLGDPHENNPRSAIGQIAPLTYALVTVDGRTDESEGVTIAELAAFMYDIGCTQAYAMDGGNSSALVFHHELLSIKNVHERDIPDVIYFATAIDN